MTVLELQSWLLTEGRRSSTVSELLSSLMPRLQRAARVDRLWLGTTVLHPQAAAYGWIWSPDEEKTVEFSHHRFALLDAQDSPLGRLRDGAPSLRVRPGEALAETLDDLRDLFGRGYTDFYAEPLHFCGAWAGGFTWSTRHVEGFSDDDLRILKGVAPALSAVIEPLARDRMYGTLMRTYLGMDAGRRVLAGQVRRGDGQSVRAAIWFSDVRGFTKMSQELARPTLLAMLDVVFQEVVEAVQQAGGQVLKFMGDGALATFSFDDDASGERACAAATEAAVDLQRRLAARRRAGEDGLAKVGVGLHFGDLMYGNIGAPGRLDFTVIGECVNLAARVEGLCARTGEPVLATEAIARRAPGWRPLRSFSVKGVGEPVEVWRRA